MHQPKKPRHYAFEIMELPTPEERRAAIDAAPPEMQATIKAHIRALWPKRRLLQTVTKK